MQRKQEEHATPQPKPQEILRVSTNRRTVLKAGAAASALAGRIWFPASSTAQQATPAPEGFLPGGDGVPDAYLKLPPPFQSVDETPANGGTVRIFLLSYGSPVPPRDENSHWQELERRLGVDRLEIQFAPPATYADQLATTIAGGDLPDLTVLHFGQAPAAQQTVFQGAWTDLTPHLSGDALQAYPNLARFDERSWRHSQIDGKYFGVPRPRWNLSGGINLRQDWADAAGIPEPANADEWFRLMDAFTRQDPDGNGQADTWGLGSHQRDVFCQTAIKHMFRSPASWRLNADGSLTNEIETEEFRATVEFQRRMFEAGLYHPNSATATPQEGKNGFISGQYGAFQDAVTALFGSTGLKSSAQQLNPNARPRHMVMPGHDGGPGLASINQAFFGIVGIPASVGQDEERLQALLRILNWLAAPFGSEEGTFKSSGIEGIHHTVNDEGHRILTELGRRELGAGELIGGPPVFYYGDQPEDARVIQNVARELMEVAIESPTINLYSPTNAEEGGALYQLMLDTTSAIVQSREPMGAYDQFVEEWRSRGGDQIRQEYEEALATQ